MMDYVRTGLKLGKHEFTNQFAEEYWAVKI
jgi:hypothetical protein